MGAAKAGEAVFGRLWSANDFAKFFHAAFVRAAINRQLVGCEFKAVLRQVIRLRELAYRDPEISQRCSRPAFLVQQLEADRPRRLIASVFPAELVYTPLKSAVKAEIVPVKG